MKSRMLFAAAIAVACIGAADPSYRVEPVENGAVVFNAHPDVSHEDCYNDPNHDAADLCAQWRAAKAAEAAAVNSGWANWLAGLGILLTAISILGLGFTVFYTKDSLLEAKKATKAAEESLAETRLTGQAQVRCYLGVIRAEAMVNNQDCLCMKFSIRNYGNSPAYDVQVKIRAEYISFDAKGVVTQNRAFKEFQARDRGSTIPPQAEFNFYPFITKDKLDAGELALMASGKFGVRLTIRINGRDVFKLPTADRPIFGTIMRKKNEWIEMHLAAHFEGKDTPGGA